MVHNGDDDKAAIRWTQLGVRMWLNRAKLAIRRNLFALTNWFTVINQWKLQICFAFPKGRVYLGQVAEIHINFVHSEFSQNLVDLKQKFWHSFKNSDVVAEGCWFNCIVTRNITRVQPAKSQVELISAARLRLIVLCWKSISLSKLHCNRLETSCLPSLDPCNCLVIKSDRPEANHWVTTWLPQLLVVSCQMLKHSKQLPGKSRLFLIAKRLPVNFKSIVTELQLKKHLICYKEESSYNSIVIAVIWLNQSKRQTKALIWSDLLICQVKQEQRCVISPRKIFEVWHVYRSEFVELIILFK